jgi:uncharacterized membrane protein
MSKYLLAYAATLLVFLAADFIWLGFLAKDFYQSQIGGLLLAKPELSAAAVFYLLYAVGVLLFVIVPAIQADQWLRASLYGALFGLIAYATYDLSNLATLKGWSLSLAVVDMLWGAFVTGLSATAGYFAGR